MSQSPTMRVLVLEPDPASLERLVRYLEDRGCVADSAATAAELLCSLEKETYDVVLLDVGRSRRESLEVLRQARRRGLQVPVIILSPDRAAPPASSGETDTAPRLPGSVRLDEMDACLRSRDT